MSTLKRFSFLILSILLTIPAFAQLGVVASGPIDLIDGVQTLTWTRTGLVIKRSTPGMEVSRTDPNLRASVVSDPTLLADTRASEVAAGRKYKMWFTTQCLNSLDGNCPSGVADHALGVKYAYSADGVTWTVQPEWALDPSQTFGAWDYVLTETPTVLQDPTDANKFRMWYAGFDIDRLINGDREDQTVITEYLIGYAEATYTGGTMRFTRRNNGQSLLAGFLFDPADVLRHATGVTSQPTTTIHGMADPVVIYSARDSKYRMWASAFTGVNTGPQELDCPAGQTTVRFFRFGIAYLESADGISWRNPISDNNLVSGIYSFVDSSPRCRRKGNPSQAYYGNDRTTPQQYFPMQPQVVWNNVTSRYEMFFKNEPVDSIRRVLGFEVEAGGGPGRANGFRYATSSDGRNWTEYQGGTLQNKWGFKADRLAASGNVLLEYYLVHNGSTLLNVEMPDGRRMLRLYYGAGVVSFENPQGDLGIPSGWRTDCHDGTPLYCENSNREGEAACRPGGERYENCSQPAQPGGITPDLTVSYQGLAIATLCGDGVCDCAAGERNSTCSADCTPTACPP